MSGLFCQLATFFLIGLFVLIILAAWAWPKFLIDDDLVGDPDLVIGLWSCAFLGQVLLMAGLVILMEWLVGKSKLERRPVLDSISHSCGPGNDLEIEEQDLEETVPADRVEITL
ncbi:unnamed protein product [Symbiodinium natans]|uniref:Uncharacterized protein n=1 Tax=Symbiodinium natans TaxID=878477 RepID=A0A812KQ53_9DINO|nr:unnamed protein product [Symbiodinium natans]